MPLYDPDTSLLVVSAKVSYDVFLFHTFPKLCIINIKILFATSFCV